MGWGEELGEEQQSEGRGVAEEDVSARVEFVDQGGIPVPSMGGPKILSYDATEDDIRSWALDPDGLCEQDWDIVSINTGLEPLFIELAANENCPKCEFFLHCLYLLVRDAVRTQGNTTPFSHLEELFTRAEATAMPWLQAWVSQSRDLMANPKKFKYDL